jgi:hypothetical protein
VRWIQNRQAAVEEWLGPFLYGLVEALLACAVLAIAFWAAAESSSVVHPSAQLFRDLAQLGAAIFIAFAIATAGAATFTGGELKLHVNWLGAACGLGLSGFLGIAASVALAAYREAGHSSWFDIFGLCWAGVSILLLGCFVAVLPYATFRWSKSSLQ